MKKIALSLAVAGCVVSSPAQPVATLHSFAAKAQNTSGVYTNSNGATPLGLAPAGGMVYGSAFDGITNGSGTIFAVRTNGTGFTNLFRFPSLNLDLSTFAQTNSVGANPNNLILAGNTLYGTTAYGGPGGSGTVFKINTNGTGFTTLYTFTALTFPVTGNNLDGAQPAAGLLLVGSTLYGTTLVGGSTANGTVFKVNTNGTGFANLHTFVAGTGTFPNVTNSQGANPACELIAVGNTLYGTTVYGGSNGRGVVFRVNMDGSGFTNMHTFTGGTGVNYQVTNIDGASPSARLLLAGGTLYGRTKFGGNSRYGTLFAIQTNGTGFSVLHTFAAGTGSYPNYTNNQGANPNSSLILSGNMLLGTAGNGGIFGSGALFMINTNGTGFTNFHNFPARPPGPTTPNNGGANPAELVLFDNKLYGTTGGGGANGSGTVFSLDWSGSGVSLPPPTLHLQFGVGALTLQWQTNYPGYAMQSSTALGNSGSWSNVSTTPAVVGTNYSLTFVTTNASRFFRLRSP